MFRTSLPAAILLLALSFSGSPQAGVLNWCGYQLEKATGRVFPGTYKKIEHKLDASLQELVDRIQKEKSFIYPARSLGNREINALLPHLKNLETLDLSKNSSLSSKLIAQIVLANRGSLRELLLGKISISRALLATIVELPRLRLLQADQLPWGGLSRFYEHETLSVLDLHLGRFSARAIERFLVHQPKKFTKLIIRSPRHVQELESFNKIVNQHQHREAYLRGPKAGQLRAKRSVSVNAMITSEQWRWDGRVSSVLDGDTFKVMIDSFSPALLGYNRSARVKWIDSPEYGSKAVTFYEGLVAYVARYKLFKLLTEIQKQNPYGMPTATIEFGKFSERFIFDFVWQGRSIGRHLLDSNLASYYPDGGTKSVVEWKSLYLSNRSYMEREIKAFGKLLYDEGEIENPNLAEILYEDFVKANKRLPPQRELIGKTPLDQSFFGRIR
nr:hypothetical protein [bacterium]